MSACRCAPSPRGPDAGKATRGDIDQVRIGVAEGNELLLTDPTVSRFHVVVTRTDDGILVVDKRSTNGTLIGAIEVERGFITPGTVLTLGESKIRIGDSAQVEVELFGGDELAGLRAGAPSMRRLFAQMRRAAQAEVPVLLRGESGTGKEGVARALHDLGSRAKKPFIIVDCASLSPTLVASELFGHEKGAFTGADRRHKGPSSAPTAARSFSTRSANSPRACSRPCSARSSESASVASVAARRSRWM